MIELRLRRVRGDDYERLIVEDEKRTEAICQFISELVLQGKLPGIVFARTVRHVQLLAERLGEVLGREVPQVTTKTMSVEEREALAEQMRETPLEVPVAVATSVWSQGVDIPSLRWVLMAGGGQAPIGLKQSAARPDRADEDKPGYEIYDWQDVGVGAEAFEEQAKRRLKHYEDAGFAVDGIRPDAYESKDEDACLLAELLAAPVSQPDAQKPVVADHVLTASEVWQAMPVENRQHAALMICMLAFLALIVFGIVCRACL